MKWIYRYITRKGFLKGNSVFVAITTVISVVKLAQKLIGTAPKTLYAHELEPGQVVVVTDAVVSKKTPKK